MTDSGNEGYHKNNDLGGRQYTDEEQQLIYFITSGLRHRDPFLTGGIGNPGYLSKTYRMPPDGVRPRDYIPAYTKIAGFVLELAKNLVVFPFPPQIPQKSLAEWIKIVTDLKVPDDLGLPALKHIEVRLLLEDKVVASSKDPPFEIGAPACDETPGPLESLGALSEPSSAEASASEPPPPNIEGLDPEKAKAILIRLCDSFPGILTDEVTDGADVVQELGLLLRAST